MLNTQNFVLQINGFSAVDVVLVTQQTKKRHSENHTHQGTILPGVKLVVFSKELDTWDRFKFSQQLQSQFFSIPRTFWDRIIRFPTVRGSCLLVTWLSVTETSLNNQSDTQFYTNNFKNLTTDLSVNTIKKRPYVGLFHRGKPPNFSDKL